MSNPINEEISDLTTEVSPNGHSVIVSHATGEFYDDGNELCHAGNLELSESIDYDEIEVSVTESQYHVITHPATMNLILRVRAGPGSGKSFTLVARIAQMLANGTKPSEILVLSMANRSVDSLKEMLSNLIGSEKAAAVEISTFHSFAAGLLELYGTILNSNYKKQNFFDESTWKNLIGFFSGKSVKFGAHAIEGNITPTRLNKAISNIMMGKQTTQEVAAEHKINSEYLSKLVTHLKDSGFVRYDELIADATRLIYYSAASLGNLWVSKEFRNEKALTLLTRITSVFVDEFQDVYPSLSQLVSAIVEYPTRDFSGLNKHLTIMGDPNQSIYDFLGVSEKDMMTFHKELPEMDVMDHILENSFRCTQPILDCAVGVALKNPCLQLKSTKIDFYHQKPILLHARSVIEEYHRVADEIVRLLCLSGGLIQMEDIAILTKTNEAAIAVQSTLKKKYGLESHKLSSGNLWVTSRLHILKQILSVIAGDASSSVSLVFILSTLDSEIGSRKRISKLFSESINQMAPGDSLFLESYLYQKLSHIEDKKTGISVMYKKYPAVLERIGKFLNQVQHEREILNEMYFKDPLEQGPQALVSCLHRMVSLDGISQFLMDDNNETSKATPIEVLESFNNSVHHAFSKYASKRDHSPTPFLDYFLQTYDSELLNTVENSVRVSTIHSAKGLEFPVVFVLGQTLYNGSWDNIMREDVAGNCDGNSGQASSHERLLLGLENHPNTESAQIVENSRIFDNSEHLKKRSLDGFTPQDPAPKSVSRLLYVALTRARGLVYAGCRSKFSDLSKTSKTKFSAALPDIRLDNEEIRGNKSPLDADYGSTRRKNEQKLINIIEGESEQLTDLQKLTVPESPASAPGAHSFPFLHSYAKDVMRPMPARQNLDCGLLLYQRIMRSANVERPIMHAPRRLHRYKPNTFVATKREHFSTSGAKQIAKGTLRLANLALHKRSI